jgi:ribosomal protein S19E (S16A)
LATEVEVEFLMQIEIVGEIENIETIAVGGRIRDIMRLRRQYGEGRWRKCKGDARVRLASGAIRRAELHWYEAHGVGRKKLKIKRFLD